MQLVSIPYRPRQWSKALHEATTRWIVLVLHRRAGKTTAALNHLQRDALRIAGSRWAYIAPTYKQAKSVAWDLLKFYASPIPGVVFNEVELTVKYPNGSKVTLYGADNPDSLRGIALWGAVFDEYSQQPSNIFGEIVSKCLADHLGYAIFLGTIKGKNQLFRTYEAGRGDKAWTALWQDIDKSLATETGETIENLRVALADDRELVRKGLMTQAELDQEWYLSTEAAIKGSYYGSQIAEARRTGRIGNVPYDAALPVYTVWDLGKGRNMAVGFYQKNGAEVRKIDYLEGSGDEGMPSVIAKVLAKPYIYAKHFAPHDIRAVELATEKTRIESARSLGINFHVVEMIPVQDGIHAGQLMFQRLWVDETKCRPWLDSMAQYRAEWDEKRGIFRDEPLHDWTSHGADEYRYAAVSENEMRNESTAMPLPTSGLVRKYYPDLGV